MKLALIGEKLGHSLSVPIHRAYFSLSGSQGSYELLELAPDQVKDLRRIMAAKGLDGVNVTIPYKKAVIPLLDQLTPMARRVGAVNTIAWRDGRLVGHNTDAGGFMDMLAFAGIPAAGQGFAVLGASGGAAQAVRAALEQAGARAYPVSRKGPVTYDSLPELDWQVLVNCTPLGMWPNIQAAPVEAAVARRAQALVDLVYNPPVTRFLAMAAPGAKAVNGLYMLVAQAMRAQAFWRDQPVDQAFTRRIYGDMAKEAQG